MPRRPGTGSCRALTASALWLAEGAPLFVCFGLGLALGACVPGPPLPLEVEYAGCETVLAGPVCVLAPDSRLRLWVKTLPDARITVEGIRNGSAADPVAVQDGLRFEIEPRDDAWQLEVHAHRDGTEATWALPLRSSEPPSWLVRARELGSAGDLEGARRAVEDALPSLSPEERGFALGILGRVELYEENAPQAEAHLRDAVRAHRDSGHAGEEMRDGTVVVHLLLGRSAFDEARNVLEELSAPPEGAAASLYLLNFFRGLLADRTGDLRAALAFTNEAANIADRLHLEREGILARERLAQELQRIGRMDEAAEIFDRLLADPLPLSECERVQLLNNAAWARLLAAETGASSASPAFMLQEALRAIHGECGGLSGLRLDVLLNLSLASLQAGDTSLARDYLEEARRPTQEPTFDQLLWRLDLDARTALADREPEAALALYDEMAARAEAGYSPEGAWRAAAGRAQALEACGAAPEALAAYGEAEAMLERRSSPRPGRFPTRTLPP